MKKVFFIIAILIVAISFSACGKKTFEGEVYQKEFKPAESQLVYIPMLIRNGETFTTVYFPTWRHYPERWVIKIRGNESGKEVREKFYVSEDVFDSVNIGDWIVFDPDNYSWEEPYIEERAE